MGENRIAVFLQALILGAVVAIALRAPSAAPDAPPIAGGDVAVLARLDRLEHQIAELRTAPRTGPTATPTEPVAARALPDSRPAPAVDREIRTAVGDVTALAHELALLRARVEGIAQVSGVGAPRTTVANLRNQPPPNWRALQEHVRRRDEDYERERQALLYLSSDEILARFGRPTSVYPGDVQGSRHWSYDHPEGEVSASFQILDGCVIDL